MAEPRSDALVLFGARGDLAHKQIFPALYEMTRRGHLNIPVVGLSRQQWTVNIPMKETVSLLVTFDERPGEWMFHCHILDHADGGLMGSVAVGDVVPSGHIHKKP